jgi:signal transduction histidine kinase
MIERGPADTSRPHARILIVDDERANRQLLETVLASEGHALVAAETGEEALAMIAREPPDLVLLDVLMPGMNGFEVTALIKGNPDTRNIPVILVTALDDREGRLRGLSAGAEDFLSKPVDRAELCARVSNLLRLKAAIEEARAAHLLAENANHAKTLFLRALSHELRTPLQAITGYAEIMNMGLRGKVNPRQAADLGRILRASGYLHRLISDLLTVARLEGARPLHLVSIAVQPVLAEVESLCVLQAKAKSLRLTIAPVAEELFVTADAERFQQVLINLVTNALKFTAKGGSVTVSCDSDRDTVRFRVADTGIGVPSQDIDRIFEPFVQIGRHLTTPTEQGVGLGLAISRDLARAMHGDLTLASIEGAGSTFTLALPMARAPFESSAQISLPRSGWSEVRACETV